MVKFIGVVSLILLSEYNLAKSQVFPKAIYGKDNRVEVETLKGTTVSQWSKSVAAMVPRDNLWKWWLGGGE